MPVSPPCGWEGDETRTLTCGLSVGASSPCPTNPTSLPPNRRSSPGGSGSATTAGSLRSPQDGRLARQARTGRPSSMSAVRWSSPAWSTCTTISPTTPSRSGPNPISTHPSCTAPRRHRRHRPELAGDARRCGVHGRVPVCDPVRGRRRHPHRGSRHSGAAVRDDPGPTYSTATRICWRSAPACSREDDDERVRPGTAENGMVRGVEVLCTFSP